ncbi:MAG: hypothetical protein JG781_879 [Peptococcaceae bacterium]|jgi:hypothetical protein|nr:hypothetical protein [Peptococcaceae bacterium]
MTVNPVDMQVLLPRVGEVNKIQRNLQQQQQMEQQVLAQVVQQDIKNKEQAVQRSNSTENKNISNDSQKKEKGKQKRAKNTKNDKEEENVVVTCPENIGKFFDIKI